MLMMTSDVGDLARLMAHVASRLVSGRHVSSLSSGTPSIATLITRLVTGRVNFNGNQSVVIPNFGNFWYHPQFWSVLHPKLVLRCFVNKMGSAAEGPHDALVSRNSATTKYPYQ